MGVSNLKEHTSQRYRIQNLADLLFAISVFCIFTLTMYPWFVWGIPHSFVYMPFQAYIVLYALMKRKFYVADKATNVFLVFITLYIAYSILFSGISSIGSVVCGLLQLMAIFCIALQSSSFKNVLFHKITDWMAILLAVSITYYLIYLLGVALPHSNINFENERYFSTNYYLFIIPQEIGFSALRFQSIFQEPGHLNMGISLLIIAHKFNIKNKSVLILLIAAILSLSLAAIVVLAVGYAGYIALVKRKFHSVILGAILLSGIFLAINSMGEDNVIYQATISRLLYDESEGTIAGNNRFTYELEQEFNKIKDTSKILTGVGSGYITRDKHGSNSGYMLFIVVNGIIGTGLCLIAYMYSLFVKNSSYIKLFCFCLLLLLIQNSYPLWNCVILNFILGYNHLKNDTRRV